MLKQAFANGYAAALARFKLAAITPPAGVNPASAAQPPVPPNGMPATAPKAPSLPNAPVAAHAAKSNILG